MILVAALAAALVTLLLAPVVIRLLVRRAVLDVPGARSSHDVPTPRGGGLAPACGALAGAAIAAAETDGLLLIIAAAAAALGVVGFRDDLGSLPARARLIAQLVIAAAVSGFLVDGLQTGPAVVLLAAGCTVWLVAYVNAFNFMDGINGISAAQASVAGFSWGLVGWWHDAPLITAAGVILGSSALAFAPFNFPRARVFLGDVGSYFIGTWVGALAVACLSHGLTAEMSVAPLAIYLADTGTTLLRRARRGESLTTPHREHTYQRLVQQGWSHARATSFAAALMAACAAGGALTMNTSALRPAGWAVVALAVAAYLLAPSHPATAEGSPVAS